MPRIFPIGFLLAFLCCYLEWGGGNSGFLFQVEYDVLFKSHNSESFKHPLVLIPFLGQLLLLAAIIWPHKKLIITGTILQGTLVFMVFLVGGLTLNLKILFSSFPFFLVLVVFIRHSRATRL
jgi:hypothetical protein